MKKFFILLSVVLCSVFVGCSKDSDDSNGPGSSSPIVGTWTYTSYGVESFQWTFKFKANGTFVETYKDANETERDNGSYTYDDPKLTMYYKYGDEVDVYEVEAVIVEDQLYFTDGSDTFVFYRQ